MTKTKQNWEISEEAKKTARHIGLISEGAIETLINETRQEAVLEVLGEVEKEIEKLPIHFWKGMGIDQKDEALIEKNRILTILKNKYGK